MRCNKCRLFNWKRRKTFFIIEIYVQFIEAISLFSADKFLAQLATESRRNQWRRKNMVIAIARDCLKTLIRNENKFRAIFLANKKIIDEININSSGGSSRVLALSLFLIGLGSLFFSLFLWKSHWVLFIFPADFLNICQSLEGKEKKSKHEKNCKILSSKNLPKYLSRNIIVFEVVSLGGARLRIKYSYLLMPQFSSHNCLFLYSAPQRFPKSRRKYSDFIR